MCWIDLYYSLMGLVLVTVVLQSSGLEAFAEPSSSSCLIYFCWIELSCKDPGCWLAAEALGQNTGVLAGNKAWCLVLELLYSFCCPHSSLLKDCIWSRSFSSCDMWNIVRNSSRFHPAQCLSLLSSSPPQWPFSLIGVTRRSLSPDGSLPEQNSLCLSVCTCYCPIETPHYQSELARWWERRCSSSAQRGNSSVSKVGCCKRSKTFVKCQGFCSVFRVRLWIWLITFFEDLVWTLK